MSSLRDTRSIMGRHWRSACYDSVRFEIFHRRHPHSITRTATRFDSSLKRAVFSCLFLHKWACRCTSSPWEFGKLFAFVPRFQTSRTNCYSARKQDFDTVGSRRTSFLLPKSSKIVDIKKTFSSVFSGISRKIMVQRFEAARTFSPVSSTWTWVDSSNLLFNKRLWSVTFENLTYELVVAGQLWDFRKVCDYFNRHVLVGVHLDAKITVSCNVFTKTLKSGH